MAKSAFKVKSGGKFKPAPKGSKAPTFAPVTTNVAGFKARPGVGNSAPRKPVSFAPVSGNSAGYQSRASFGNKPMNPQPVQGQKKPTGAQNKQRKKDMSFGEKASRTKQAAMLNIGRKADKFTKEVEKAGGASAYGKQFVSKHKGKLIAGAGVAAAGMGVGAYRKRQEDKKFKNRIKDRLGIRR